MIYKKENEIGFKTAKRRMLIEVQEVILSVTAILLGGDPQKIGLSPP
jgi:hypothetical protein